MGVVNSLLPLVTYQQKHLFSVPTTWYSTSLSDLPAKTFSVPTTWYSTSLEVLVPKGEMFILGDTEMISLN